MDLGDVIITFPPGNTSAVYRAQIHEDAIDEVDENVFFEIVSASEARIELSLTDAYRILGRILDNDLPSGPTVRFGAGAQGSQSFVSEGAGSFTMTLTLSHALSRSESRFARSPGRSTAPTWTCAILSLPLPPGKRARPLAPRSMTTASTRSTRMCLRDVAVSGASIDLSSFDAFRILGRILDNDVAPILSTAQADTLAGTAGNDMIDGLGGNNMLSGYAGADTLRGGETIPPGADRRLPPWRLAKPQPAAGPAAKANGQLRSNNKSPARSR